MSDQRVRGKNCDREGDKGGAAKFVHEEPAFMRVTPLAR